MPRDQSYTEREILAYADQLDNPTEALDGRACLFCEGHAGPMEPVGSYDGCQIFAHLEGGCDVE